MIYNTKKCTKCNIEKILTDFNRCNKVKDGRKSVCRLCIVYYPKSKEIARRDTAKYRLNNPEKVKENYKKWYEKNKHIKRHKTEETKEKNKIWCVKNRERINELRRKRNKNPKPNQIIEKTIRDRFYKVIVKMKSGIKHKSCMLLIGCDISELKKHIESQFKDGMNWENHGNGENKWNIDHIKPLFTFDLNKIEEQMIAFNYKNLRPLWFYDNIRRNKKDWCLTV